MPTYSYKCTECGTAFDIQQAFTDDALTECPNCRGKLRKVYNTIGVTFNGSGFYRTDSRGKPASESGSSSGSSSAGSSSAGSSSAGSSTSGSSSSGSSSSGGGSTSSSSAESKPAASSSSAAS